MITASSRSTISYVGPGLATLIGGLLCVNTLVYIESTVAIGRTSMVVMLLIPGLLALIHLLTGSAIPRGFRAAVASLAVLCLLMAPRDGLSQEAVVPFLQVVLVTIFFAGAAILVWPWAAIRPLSTVASLWCLGVAVYWFFEGCPSPCLAYFENPNACGGNLLFALAVSQLAPSGRSLFWRAYSGFVLIATTGMIVATVSRSALLGLMVGLVIYAVWPLLNNNRAAHRLAFAVIVAGIALFVVGNALVIEHLEQNGYAELSNRLTGKNLGTREVVWRIIAEAIADQPFRGYGATVKPSDFIGADLSAHCLFLQVGLAAGLAGVASLVTALALIWDRLWVEGNDPTVRVAGATLAGLMIHQTFEVSLIQNHLAIGCLGWVVLGIGVSRTLKRHTNQPNCALA